MSLSVSTGMLIFAKIAAKSTSVTATFFNTFTVKSFDSVTPSTVAETVNLTVTSSVFLVTTPKFVILSALSLTQVNVTPSSVTGKFKFDVVSAGNVILANNASKSTSVTATFFNTFTVKSFDSVTPSTVAETVNLTVTSSVFLVTTPKFVILSALSLTQVNVTPSSVTGKFKFDVVSAGNVILANNASKSKSSSSVDCFKTTIGNVNLYSTSFNVTIAVNVTLTSN